MRSRLVILLLVACGSGRPAPRPPSAPLNLAARAGDGQVTLLWDASEGAIGYRVYSGTGALATHADVGAVTAWTVAGLSDGTAYSFAVSALGAGGESALSSTVTATPKAPVVLAVLSVSPADGTTAVPRSSAVAVRFNAPATNVVAGCSGTLQVSDDSFATCADGTVASSDGGATWTFTPAAPLHASATYRTRVTTGVTDANGMALSSAFTSAGFTTAKPAVQVTGSDFQHISLAWIMPAAATEARAYVRPAGGSYSGYSPFSGTTGKLGPLPPFGTWDVKVTTVAGGVETAAGEVTGIVCSFAGTEAEWEPAQTVTGERGGGFHLTWNAARIFAAYSGALNDANGDALWIGFDTGAPNGVQQSDTGGGALIWPFKVNFIVAIENGQARLLIPGQTAQDLIGGTVTTTGVLHEISFPRDAIGDPAAVKVAFAAVAMGTGHTFDLAPKRITPAQTPTLGKLASATGFFASSLDSAKFAALPAPASAPSLVHFTLTGVSPAAALKIAGSVAPLSYDLTQSDYALVQTDVQTWEASINFGGAPGELFFRFVDGAAPEFAATGVDRVFTLSGSAESLPSLKWATAYGKTGSFHLVFNCTANCGTARELREFPPAGSYATLAAPFSGTADVVFTARDFVTSPLKFKAWYGISGLDDYEGNADHLLDDDVINTRTLTWSAGDSASF